MLRLARWRPTIALAVTSLALPNIAFSQKRAADTSWSIEATHGPSRPFKATVDEGTWMSLDVSPDGRTVAFDLLGDLFAVPMEGGIATRLTNGRAWDATPRFSPDGRRILFVSDRSGSEQLWTIDANGANAAQITRDAANQYDLPVWTPDGSYVIALKKPLAGDGTPQSYALLHTGGGTGVKLAGDAGLGPTLSSDGRWLYYARNAGGRQVMEIVRVDRSTGERAVIVGGYDDPGRPQASHDARRLAFIATIDGKRCLMVRDLEGGVDRVLYRDMDRLEAWANDDLDEAPGYAFTPDDGAIVFAAGGKIRRVDVASGAATVIPFRATLENTLTERIYVRGRVPDGPLSPKVLHWAQPVGAGRLVFGAAGRIYLYDVAQKRATPFAEGQGLQYAPAVSPDGRWIAYVNWIDTVGGTVMKAPVAGGAPVAITSRAGRFHSVSWSPDGRRLALAEERGSPDYMTTINYDLLVVDADRANAPARVTTIHSRGERKAIPRPTFDASGARLYYSEPDTAPVVTATMELWSTTLDGRDRRRLARSRYSDEITASPDGKWLAFTQRQDVYLAPLPPMGTEPIDVRPQSGDVPVHRLSRNGADYLYWLDGGASLGWSWGPKVTRVELARAGAGDSTAATSTVVGFTLPRSEGHGVVMLHDARLVTMKGDEVIEHGDVLVRDSRIAAIGPVGRVTAPAGTRTIDMSGKTIIPGFIDIHAHYSVAPGMIGIDLFPSQNTELLANLAYGVTTWRDPSARSQTIFSLAEMVEAGAALGPRIFSSGDIFFAAEWACCGQAKSLDDAREMVRRQKALGATSIKEHTDPQRRQVQWIVRAAREESLMVATDPVRGHRGELRTLFDGVTSLEHLYAVTPIKRDAIELFAQSGVFYAPTLVIFGVEDYYQTQLTNGHEDPRVRRFIPHMKLDRDIHNYARWRMPAELALTRQGESIRDLTRAGVKVGLGSHGQVQGLGAHWELWGMARDVTPLEALRMATMNGAEALGYQDDLGSLEAGKLADLIVLSKNPLEDITNTTSIAYVMKGGVLWNGETMDEIWPTMRVRPKGAWEVDRR